MVESIVLWNEPNIEAHNGNAQGSYATVKTALTETYCPGCSLPSTSQ